MKNVKNFLIRQVENHNTPSIQYIFFNTNSIAFELRHGWKNIQSKTPVEATTTYHLFSVTKTFTALAALQLAQSGKVELSRSASEYLPDFPYSDRITVEQLLSHTSGIPNPLPLKWIHLLEEHQQFNQDEFFAEVFNRWKPFRPFYINGAAYGGMVGSGTGLVHYAQALLRHDSVLLDPQYKKILFTEKIVQGKPTGMSFSWFTGSLKGNTYFAHAGGGGGYYVELRIYPDLGAGSVIMYNRSGMSDQRILDHVDRSFLSPPP